MKPEGRGPCSEVAWSADNIPMGASAARLALYKLPCLVIAKTLFAVIELRISQTMVTTRPSPFDLFGSALTPVRATRSIVCR
jgi:hypothetical protein